MKMNYDTFAFIDELKKIFLTGFEFGRKEQQKRDFPDVGWRFDLDGEEYWKEMLKKLNEKMNRKGWE
jgi:hypothetical protein